MPSNVSAPTEVHPAGPGDAEEIHRILLAAFKPFREQYTHGCFDATVLDPERIRHRMTEGPVFLVPGKGTVSCRRDDRGLYVRGLAVHPEARRQGIGRTLLDACRAEAERTDAPGIWLSTTLFLAGSIALYQAYGFEDAAGPVDLHGTPLRSFELRLGLARPDTTE